MISPDNYYCKASAEDVLERIVIFIEETTKLPHISVAEVVDHHHFADLYEPHINRRRQMLEVTQMLQDDGWHRSRRRGARDRASATPKPGGSSSRRSSSTVRTVPRPSPRSLSGRRRLRATSGTYRPLR